jgi:hypothetical protein
MWDPLGPPIDPEPAAVAPDGMGKLLGQPEGNFPSRDTETDPSGVLTEKDRFGEVVEGEEDEEEDFEGDEVQPTISSKARTARARVKEVMVRLSMPSPVGLG